jgi:hypothetical protein
MGLGARSTGDSRFCSLGFSSGGFGEAIGVRTHDHALTGRGHEGSVFGPEVNEPVRKAVVNGLDTNVQQDPFGGDELHHAQGVVERIASALNAPGLTDAEGHKIAVMADTSLTSGMRAHTTERPLALGLPGPSSGRSSKLTASTKRTSINSLIDPSCPKR